MLGRREVQRYHPKWDQVLVSDSRDPPRAIFRITLAHSRERDMTPAATRFCKGIERVRDCLWLEGGGVSTNALYQPPRVAGPIDADNSRMRDDAQITPRSCFCRESLACVRVYNRITALHAEIHWDEARSISHVHSRWFGLIFGDC